MIKGCKPFKDEDYQYKFDDEFNWDEANRRHRNDNIVTGLVAAFVIAGTFVIVWMVAGGY